MNKLFVFDLDDTILDNVHDYGDPILDSCRLIIHTLGSKAPHVSKIIAMEQEIDKRRITQVNPDAGKLFMYSMERFPGSLVETYREICCGSRIIPDNAIEKQLFEIGLQAFNPSCYKKNIKPHMKEIVQFLSSRGSTLGILSKGDSRVQENKFKALQEAGIFELFSSADIVEREKTTEDFARIASRFSQCKDLWAIGNDYEKDILPAFEAGFRGIFIPVETWEMMNRMEEIFAKVDRTRCRIFENLFQIEKQYEELT